MSEHAVEPALLERWLDARDHVAMRRTWEALHARLTPVGSSVRRPTLHGAALLAEAMLGARADWLVDPAPRTPTFSVQRISDGAFLDHVWNIDEANQESLTIHERRDGLRGVQLVSLSSGTITGRPEGGGVMAVRIFDRDRAAVVPIDPYVAPEVATIGVVDLAPLDLLVYSGPFTLPGPRDVATARALMAQLLAELDAHFDTSTEWPEGAAPEPGEWWVSESERSRAQCFVRGPRAISVAYDRFGRLLAQAHGLAWGQRLSIQLDEGSGHVVLRFSSAELDRILARLSGVGGSSS